VDIPKPAKLKPKEEARLRALEAKLPRSTSNTQNYASLAATRSASCR
jgi:hypothetical protein